MCGDIIARGSFHHLQRSYLRLYLHVPAIFHPSPKIFPANPIFRNQTNRLVKVSMSLGRRTPPPALPKSFSSQIFPHQRQIKRFWKRSIAGSYLRNVAWTIVCNQQVETAAVAQSITCPHFVHI